MSRLVEKLQKRIDETIVPLVRDQSPGRIAILDAPDYPNVGDPLIFLGQMAFLRRAFPRATYVIVSHRTYTDRVDREIERADCLFLTGGGSFGDAWPLHQNFRLHVIERFGHKPIIHFPQSFHFGNPQSLSKTKKVLERARSLTILARDAKGLRFAREHFPCESELCPDMAFSVGSLSSPKPDLDFSCLLRTDKELLLDKKTEIESCLRNAGATFTVSDWLKNRGGIEKAHGAARLLLRKGFPPEWLARHGLSLFEAYARSRLRHGVALLARGRVVITDRLHGAILATLLGRERYIFDSVDGKIRAFYETWLAEEKDAMFFDDIQQLQDQLHRSEAA